MRLPTGRKPRLKRNNVVRAGLFGSFIHREETPDSDIDLLIDFGDNRKTLFDLVDIEEELESALERKVDLVFYDGLKPRLRRKILEEQIQLL